MQNALKAYLLEQLGNTSLVHSVWSLVPFRSILRSWWAKEVWNRGRTHLFVFVFDKQNDVIVPVDDIVVGGIFRRLLPSDSCGFERICQEYCKNLSIFRFALLELLNCHIDIFLAIAAAVWQSPFSKIIYEL